jgi:fatty aldehyde-generating acyl-ACP reductase
MEKVKKFAFVSNIIETKDIRLKAFYPMLGYLLPLFVWEWIFVLRAKMGMAYSCVCQYDVFGQVTGYTVLVEMTAKQLVSRKHLRLGKKVILQACLYAQNTLGVDVICLGSLTKSITNEGEFLVKNGVTIAVTHGDSYTTASAINGVKMIQERFKLKSPVIAVVGAYGKIGRALCLILHRMGYEVVAMGRNEKDLVKLKAESSGKIITTMSLKEALALGGIAVMTTSATSSLITEEVIEKDKVYYIYDLGQPYNLFPDDYYRLVKNGYKIIRIDGGFEGSKKPFNIWFWMRLSEQVMYACYVEGVLQALENDRGTYVGPVDLAHVEQTMKWAKKWGFAHLPLSCYGVPLDGYCISHAAYVLQCKPVGISPEAT